MKQSYVLNQYLNRTAPNLSWRKINLGLHAGADWSGRPGKADDLLVCAVVMLGELEQLNQRFAALRQLFGMRHDDEFHGHQMSPDMICQVLQAGCALEIQVGVLFVEQSGVSDAFLQNLTHAATGLALLQNIVPHYEIAKIWYDEDINGSKAQQQFETEIYRINRHMRPQARMKARARKSQTSNLIQPADVLAYALSWQKRKNVEHQALQELLRGLQSDERNVFMSWNE